MEGCVCCGISILQRVFILFVNPLLGRTLKSLATFFLTVPKLTEYWPPLNLCLEFWGEGACRWFHPPEDQSWAPCFSQDHKRNLISDVEKLQAWLRLTLESRVRGRLGWEQGDLRPGLALEKWPRRCVCPHLTLGRVLDGKWTEAVCGAGRRLICWGSSVVSGPTGHQPWNRLSAFLE